MATRELCVMADSNVQDETRSRVADILRDVLPFQTSYPRRLYA